MKTIRVETSRSYDAVIAGGLLDEAGPRIKNAAGGSNAVILSDDNVYPLYGEKVASSLASAGYGVTNFIIKNGEASKNAANYIALLNFMAGRHLTRSDVLVGLGGGVVGDLAGFAASTYLRGIPLVLIPTTLLAAVDSSVGGKNAIDLDAGKNLAGTFYQPSLVLCDPRVLSTLEESVFTDGCAEVIKYGVITDKELFNMLETPVKDRLEEVISRCVGIKRDIVCGDEFDTGLRQLLNFGHTVGHAVELCSGYTIPHGSAVSIGMAVISRAAAATGLCSPSCRDGILAMLKRYGLPAETPFGPDDLFNAALSDKKRSGGLITLVMPEEIGRCVLKKYTLAECAEIIRLGTESGEGAES